MLSKVLVLVLVLRICVLAPTLARVLPKVGKWSFRTLKGWGRRRGRWVHVHMMVNTTSNYCMCMYMRFIDIIYLNRCMGCVPAYLGASLSQGRKVEIRQSQGIGQVWGWVGTCSCDVPYSCKNHYFCNKIFSKIPRGTIKLNRCMAACRPALVLAFPRGGKWSFHTLRGLARRWGW